MSGKVVKAREPHECQICNKYVSTYSNLRRHVRSKHNEQPETSKKSSDCQFEDCDYHYFKLNQYREHLFQKHEIAYATNIIEFSTKEAFTTWLESTEQYSSTRFTVGVSRPMKEGCSKAYYYCSRSGRFQSRSTGQRKPKAQGSCKIGTRCPSGFVLTTVEGKSPKYTVEYYPTHLGHDNQLGHAQIPRSVRRNIAEQLTQGLPERTILENYRSSLLQSDDLNRVHLLTLKDINNIRTSLGIPHSLPFTRSTMAPPSDPSITSVELWVKAQHENAETSPLLFYKYIGEEHPRLPSEDLVLVLMTPFQRRITANYAHGGVCVDSATVGDLSLTTLMCLDGSEEGYPAAFCVSSSISPSVIRAFLECVKAAVGTVTPAYLMSDDVTLYYDAWCAVMGPVDGTRLSVWHVWADWLRYLECVADVEKRHAASNALAECMREKDATRFEATLGDLVEELSRDDDEDVQNLKDHLVESYCGRVEVWAACYRQGTGSESDLRAESIHKALGIILNKADQSVVRLLDAVVGYVNVRLFGRIVNMHKGKKMSAAKAPSGLRVSCVELHAEAEDDDEMQEVSEEGEDVQGSDEAEVVIEEQLDGGETGSRDAKHKGLFVALNECIAMFNDVTGLDFDVSDEQCIAMHGHLDGLKRILADVASAARRGQDKSEMDTSNEDIIRVLLTEHNYSN